MSEDPVSSCCSGVGNPHVRQCAELPLATGHSLKPPPSLLQGQTQVSLLHEANLLESSLQGLCASCHAPSLPYVRAPSYLCLNCSPLHPCF
jgi:hypothetical protein